MRGLDHTWCGVQWCGVVCSGAVWCAVVWCGVVCSGVVWCAVVWCGVQWCAEGAVTKRQWPECLAYGHRKTGCEVVWCSGVVRCGAVRCCAVRVVQCGMTRCVTVQCGRVRCGAVRWCTLHKQSRTNDTQCNGPTRTVLGSSPSTKANSMDNAVCKAPFSGNRPSCPAEGTRRSKPSNSPMSHGVPRSRT